MNFIHRSGAERNQSRILRAIIFLQRMLPQLVYDAAAWRFSNYACKQMRLASYNGKPSFLYWGRHIGYSGNGRVEFQGSFAIGNCTHFEVSAPACVTIADRVRLDVGVMIYAYTGEIHLQPRVYIGPYSFLQSEGRLTIGEDTMIGPRVNILAYSRTTDQGEVPYADQPVTSKNIHIGKNVWIGAGVTILDGVNIGDNAIVGAGSVVTKNVAEGTVVAGVPAKFMRHVKAPEVSAAHFAGT